MKIRGTIYRVFLVGIVFVGLPIVACSSGPRPAAPAAPLPQSASAPQDMGAAQGRATTASVKPIVQLIESGDAASLAGLVRASGLIIASYGVGAPGRGLTGEAAGNALRAMLTGATPRVMAYAIPQPGRVDLIVNGLNSVQITPAVGEALTITSPAQVSVLNDEQGNWEVGMVAVDAGEVLNQSMGQSPFRPWPPAE